MIIPASVWNQMVDFYFRHRLLGVLDLGGGNWRHPWHTTVAWNAEKERFEAAINPGLVNGRDVMARVESADDPLVVIDQPLTSSPRIALGSFRAVPSGAPEFFAALGVRSTASLTVDDLEASAPVDLTEAKLAGSSDADVAASILPERWLKACDVVLHQERPRTVVDWQITPPEIGQQAQFTVGSTGALAKNAYVRATAEFVAAAPRDDRATLTGETEDSGLDSVKICTVFLLSPPDVGPEAEIDSRWEPHVQHDLFWNASYRFTQPVAVASQNLTLNLAGLGNAAGAQFTVNQLLAQNNDAFNAALQFLNAREVTGKFTTPGNSVRKWDKAASLDPPFPYKGLP